MSAETMKMPDPIIEPATMVAASKPDSTAREFLISPETAACSNLRYLPAGRQKTRRSPKLHKPACLRVTVYQPGRQKSSPGVTPVCCPLQLQTADTDQGAADVAAPGLASAEGAAGAAAEPSAAGAEASGAAAGGAVSSVF